MDPINLLVIVNLVLTFFTGISAAKQGIRQKLSKVKERPKTFLQKLPPNIAAFLILIIILNLFAIGAFLPDNSLLIELVNKVGIADTDNFIIYFRTLGLLLYVAASWFQIKSVNQMGKSYSQEILILNKHSLVKTGFFKFIRHPQYLFQFLMDLGVGIALLSWLIVPIALLIELPLLIMRAKMEETLLTKHFGDEYTQYKKNSGFFIPFIG